MILAAALANDREDAYTAPRDWNRSNLDGRTHRREEVKSGRTKDGRDDVQIWMNRREEAKSG